MKHLLRILRIVYAIVWFVLALVVLGAVMAALPNPVLHVTAWVWMGYGLTALILDTFLDEPFILVAPLFLILWPLEVFADDEVSIEDLLRDVFRLFARPFSSIATTMEHP